MADQTEGPNSGHLGTAWETAVVAAFATIIVLVGVIAFYFRRRRIRRRVSVRVQSPTNASRDLEQGTILPSYEKSSEFREANNANVAVSIAKPERAASASSPRESISSSSHYFHQTTQKQGTFGPHRYYWEPK